MDGISNASDQESATRETAEVKDDKELVKLWLDALSLADSEEKAWREAAQDTVNIYRNSKQKLGDILGANDRKFNILHSNVETVLPAIYNSTPVPDVRRRFNDPDTVGKAVADMIERALSFAVDAYDFDDIMRHAAKDMELTGRGLSRVRYVPYFGKQEAENKADGVNESGQELGETLDYEEAICEHVPWKHFRHGPGRTWSDVPWIAFELFLTRDELLNLSPKVGGKVNLDSTISGAETDKRDGENIKEVFKRARIWEIWDKESRKVYFIATSYKDAPIQVADDPLELMGFFPIPKPLYAIETSDTLLPVIPYDIYKDQAEELERVSRRIMALVEAIKSRGIYDGSMQEIDKLSEAEDNTLIAVQNATRYADGAGLDKGISWWPIEAAVNALKQLVDHRDRIKQVIYEITGIADILRGQTDPNETLGAQEIKQQWGSLRIQNKQQAIQRYARDLFRLKAEIIASKFQFETIAMMTGIEFPSMEVKQQAQMLAQRAQQSQQPLPEELKEVLDKPAREEVEQLLRNDAMRGFRVDVQSDSTIRADLSRNQQNMNMFLQGTAQFAAAMGPIVMAPQFQGLAPAVMEIYAAFARNFKLGKQAEDALDGVADNAKELAKQPKQPDPALEVEKAKAQAAQEKSKLDLQMAQEKHRLEMEKMQAELQIKKEELQLKEQELQMKAQAAQVDMQMQQQKQAMDAEAQQRDMAFQERQASMQMMQSEREHEFGMEATETKHKVGMEAIAAKAKAAKAKPSGARA